MTIFIRIPRTLEKWQNLAVEANDDFVDYANVKFETCEIQELIDTLPTHIKAVKDSDGDYMALDVETSYNYIPKEIAILPKFKLKVSK